MKQTFAKLSPFQVDPQAIEQQFGIKIDKKKVSLKSDIKAFGTYSAEIRLYTGIAATVTVEVEEG